jgi:type II secretory pathway pseudopilin PulG
MAALLVALAVMAVLMTAALPVWRHDAQREKEEELVFRGQQYVRAIRLFQTRNQTLPTSFDALIQGHFIRKKYKDPITNEDFLPIPVGGAIPGQGGPIPGQNFQPGGTGGQSRPGAPTPSSSSGPPRSSSTPSGGGIGTSTPLTQGPTSSTQMTSSIGSGGIVAGGITGVMSKSKEESIRLYQGRNHYNEWAFLFVNQAPGVPGGGRGVPGGPGGQTTPGPQRGGPGRGGTGTGSPFPGSGTFPGGTGFPGSPGAPGGTRPPGTGRPTVPGGGRGPGGF